MTAQRGILWKAKTVSQFLGLEFGWHEQYGPRLGSLVAKYYRPLSHSVWSTPSAGHLSSLQPGTDKDPTCLGVRSGFFAAIGQIDFLMVNSSTSVAWTTYQPIGISEIRKNPNAAHPGDQNQLA